MKKLISIVGQTSSGKSDLGIKLAKEFDGEIVSADSRQVYKGLDYCSGKVTEEEQREVKHHLIDVADFSKQFTLYDYQCEAYRAIDKILAKGKIPFLVGGTGLYSRSVVEGFCLSNNEVDRELREKLNNLSKEQLLKICNDENIAYPEEVTARRLVRLIEEKNTQKQPNSPRYEILQIGIRWKREEIYNRIKLRLENRMPNMIKEIQGLLDSGVSEEFLITLGLEAKYVVLYLKGNFDNYDEFFDELYKEERHFAKRQDTWYKKEKNIVWLDAEDNLFENAKKVVAEFLKN